MLTPLLWDFAGGEFEFGKDEFLMGYRRRGCPRDFAERERGSVGVEGE